MNKRLVAALASYAVLALLATFTLNGDPVVRKMRAGVWVLLAGLAVKTYIAHKARW